ncbi:hypothetical protein ACIO02_27270 [Streptomyces sp. NPDC087568]|uniref:hypothetical protein n=1 Tax=unclassified Streptomyces TaxID=2593676 RepID=UPI0037F99944
MSESKTRKARLTLAALGVLVVGALIGGGVTAATMLGGDGSNSGKEASSSPTTSKPSASSGGAQAAMTPDKARKLVLETPTGLKEGLSTGFSKGPVGAISTAVYFWEEYAFLDDQKARQQLDAAVSPDATGYVDEQISEVRKLREGAGLPPSGGTPAGVTFNTTVNAVRVTSLDDTGKVVQVWMNYDRYATKADGSPDNDPLKDQVTDLILKLQSGTWKITNESQYWKQRTFPVSYRPDSHTSWEGGWQQVRHAD